MKKPRSRKLKKHAYTAAQWTWGLPQTLIGAALYVAHHKDDHFDYRGAKATAWDKDTGISLGKFIFVPRRAGGNAGRFLLEHEYGHTIQSLILGPMYLPTIGLPSVIWLNFPGFKHWRRRTGTSYYSFFTERSANHLAERVLNRPAMGSISGKSDANKLRKLSLGKNRPRAAAIAALGPEQPKAVRQPCWFKSGDS